MSLAAILGLLESVLTNVVGLIQQAIAASITKDPATLDALHAKALAAANALAPAGDPPLT